MLRLPHCDVALYLLDRRSLAAEHLRARGYLDRNEIARRDIFAREEDRDRFTLGRAMLRAALGRALDRAAHAISFTLEVYGRPFLADEPEIGFSLSHSGDYIALAVSAIGPEVGVDVEAFDRSIDFVDIARSVLAIEEHARLTALPAAEREDYFLALWTLKEAHLKATGQGLQIDPSQCVINPDPPYAALRVPGEDVHRLSEWRFARWRIAPRASLALAVRSALAPRIARFSADTLVIA